MLVSEFKIRYARADINSSNGVNPKCGPCSKSSEMRDQFKFELSSRLFFKAKTLKIRIQVLKPRANCVKVDSNVMGSNYQPCDIIRDAQKTHATILSWRRLQHQQAARNNAHHLPSWPTNIISMSLSWTSFQRLLHKALKIVIQFEWQHSWNNCITLGQRSLKQLAEVQAISCAVSAGKKE